MTFRPIAVLLCALASRLGGAAPEFSEHRGVIAAEVEDATLRSAEVSARDDASGGKVVGWADATGRAEFTLRVFTPGVWHVWIRTAAKDHVSNGLFLELNGVRQRAPAGHRFAGVDSIYLRKHPTNFSWKPEWQGPAEGNHAGPITIEIPEAGLHRLAIVARKIERPTLDKIVLTREAAPAFVQQGADFGPPATRRESRAGPLLVRPQNAARLARFRAADGVVPHAANGDAGLAIRQGPAAAFGLDWSDPAMARAPASCLHHDGGDPRLRRLSGIGAECAVAILPTRL